jgi:hypothetical protein
MLFLGSGFQEIVHKFTFIKPNFALGRFITQYFCQNSKNVYFTSISWSPHFMEIGGYILIVLMRHFISSELSACLLLLDVYSLSLLI